MTSRSLKKTDPVCPVWVDPRVGSKELYPMFLKLGTPCEITPLQFADCAFIGNGPRGASSASVGIERKGIRDLLSSLMSDRLVGHQLPGLITAYDYVWIVIEGPWRVNRDSGLVETPQGPRWGPVSPRTRGDGLARWLLTLELRGGVRLRQTHNLAETAGFITDLHAWWTAKDWQAHGAHLALYAQPDSSLFVRPNLTRRWAAELPGIGYEKSQAVAHAFASPLTMACAGELEWQKIPGIGKTLASRIVKSLRGS